jgi:hypothetical protein
MKISDFQVKPPRMGARVGGSWIKADWTEARA